MSMVLGLCLFAFFAGFIDAVAGGGGLIQLPALFIFLPEASISSIYGTNKLSSICGTLLATTRYLRVVKINWKRVIPIAIAAGVFSYLGSRAVSLLDKNILLPVVIVLLICVAVYTFLKKDFGDSKEKKAGPKKYLVYGLPIGIVMGFYDGFFGPGMGSFLIFLFIGIFGLNFLSASAESKIVNLSTNLASLALFISRGEVFYRLAIPMAFANMTGSYVGSHLAIKKGSSFVRVLFLVVVSGVILRFGYDVLQNFLKKP